MLRIPLKVYGKSVVFGDLVYIRQSFIYSKKCSTTYDIYANVNENVICTNNVAYEPSKTIKNAFFLFLVK